MAKPRYYLKFFCGTFNSVYSPVVLKRFKNSSLRKGYVFKPVKGELFPCNNGWHCTTLKHAREWTSKYCCIVTPVGDEKEIRECITKVKWPWQVGGSKYVFRSLKIVVGLFEFKSIADCRRRLKKLRENETNKVR